MELLIVIAIVGVLMAVILIVINPVELLRQARDGARLSGMNTLNRALNLYQVDVANSSLGDPSTTYFSLVDSTATTTAGTNCQGLGLAPPSGWNYHCAASSTVGKVDGTGWMPVNFTQISAGSPLGTLPVDPVNTSSSGNYYWYTPGGSWVLATLLESQKYLTTKAPNDGGYNPGRYEVGSNLSLQAKAEGLVGWWTFDEGNGTAGGDSSGNGNTATFFAGTPTWNTSCKVRGCLSFGGSSDMKVNANASFNNYPGGRTVSAWVYRTSGSGFAIEQAYGGATVGNLEIAPNQKASTYRDGPSEVSCTAGTAVNTWYHLAVIQNRDTSGKGYLQTYVNGAQACSTTGLSFASGGTWDLWFGARGSVGDQFFNGQLDDVRMYSRALSGSEIQAIYGTQK